MFVARWPRRPRADTRRRSFVATTLLQSTGQLKGVVRSGNGTPVPNVVVVVTNQVTRKVTRSQSNADGSYSVRLPVGAYRLKLDQPAVAAFDPAKSYGEYAIV